MRTLGFGQAVDDALAHAMERDPSIVVFGEDVPLIRRELYVRFGPKRVRGTPISEAAFLGAGVGAAMAGLRPVVEIMMIDFLPVAIDALVNHAAKTEVFSGGRWSVPLVVRAACGGGYGDGGQHNQALWGWLAHIPGISVVVPSTPADAGGLLLSALEHPGPVVFCEHKLLVDFWRDFLAGSGRPNVTLDVPDAGDRGEVPEPWEPVPLGRAAVRRGGSDLTMVSLGVGVHRCLEAAEKLSERGVSAGVIDLRSVAPLDRDTVCSAAAGSGRLLVVDEDFRGCGLSGELAATLLEGGVDACFARVCTEDTVPFAPRLERDALPNVSRILEAADSLLGRREQRPAGAPTPRA